MDKRDEALSLARDFERDGFRVPNLYERFWRLQGDAAAYFTLADSLLRGRQEGGTLLKDAMCYMGEEAFKALRLKFYAKMRRRGAKRSKAKARSRRKRMHAQRARTNARAKAHGNVAEMKKRALEKRRRGHRSGKSRVRAAFAPVSWRAF